MTMREWWLVVRYTIAVLRDSRRTTKIHRVAEITSRGRFTALLQDLRAHGREPDMLAKRPQLTPPHVDIQLLRTLPAETLGGAYARHLDAHRLEMFLDDTPADHVDDPDVRYLIRRYRQVHDIWHVLLGLGTRGHEEVLVHAFVLGHLRLPISALVVLFGSVKHMVLEARWAALRHALREAYDSGRQAEPLLLVQWEDLWDEPIDALRRRYRIQPSTPAWVEG
ncbi:MAG: Coq4 family protein [Myxococcota bacterium]